MGNPLDGIRQFYDRTIQPVVDDVAEAVAPVVEAAQTVGGAVAEGANDVSQAVRQQGVSSVAQGLAQHHLATQAQILTELTRRSPVDFVEWLAGPEGPKVSDYTAQIPGLQQAMGEVIDTAMSNPLVAGAAGRAFGFEYVPAGDFYTTNESSLQSYFGFHDLYDRVGKLMGMDLDEEIIHFESGGVEYRLELWKGSYGSGGAYGGEIGLYTRGAGDRGPLGDFLELIPGYSSAANGDHQVRMTQTISVNGEPRFTNAHAGADGTDGEHYWNLAIRTDPGVNHENISQSGTLVCQDPQFAQAAYAAMQRELGADNVSLSPDGLTISYTWS